MAEILGTLNDDSLVGSGEGDDSIVGLEGNDTLIIEDYSGSSNTLDGGAGSDYLQGYSNNSLLRGGDDNDILEVFETNQDGRGNTLEGGLGDDTLRARRADDELLMGGPDDNLLLGGDGNDILEVWGGRDNTLEGGDGNDILTVFDGGKNTLEGGLGDDTLSFTLDRGSSGDNVLRGGGGSDTYYVATQVAAGMGIFPEGGVEIDDAEGPADTLIAIDFNETPLNLSATALAAGTHGLGRVGSSLVIDVTRDGVAILGQDIVISNFFDASGTAAGTGFIETVDNLSGQEILANAANLPEVTFQEQGPPVIPPDVQPVEPPAENSNSGDGNSSTPTPTPVGPAAASSVVVFTLPSILPSSPETVQLPRPEANVTGLGEPTGLQPNQVDGDFYNLSDSDDNIILPQIAQAIGFHIRGLSGNDIIQGSEGADEMNGNAGNDIVKGNIGNDMLRGGQGADEVDGESGDDVLNGNLDNDNVFGGAGNDLVRGGKNDDNLMGGDGDDVLVGDMGQDFLTGQGGSDTCVLRSGEAAASSLGTADVILDFNSSEDKIGLTDGVEYSNLTFESVNFGLDGTTAQESVAIKVSSTYLGIVQGVTEEDLTASMFVTADELILLG